MLFAGEVFPIALAATAAGTLARRARMWNLYGPTETNVCTAYPIPDTIPDDRDDPLPDRPRSARRSAPGWSTTTAATCPPGTVGELVIAGPGVMRGYFGRPELTERGIPPRRPTAPDGIAPATWSATTAPAATRSTAVATGWSRSAATGSSSARSSRPSIATRASTAPAVVARPDEAGRLDRRVRRAQARPEEVDHRHEAALHDATCRTTWSPTRSRSSTACRRPRPTRSTTSA